MSESEKEKQEASKKYQRSFRWELHYKESNNQSQNGEYGKREMQKIETGYSMATVRKGISVKDLFHVEGSFDALRREGLPEYAPTPPIDHPIVTVIVPAVFVCRKERMLDLHRSYDRFEPVVRICWNIRLFHKTTEPTVSQ